MRIDRLAKSVEILTEKYNTDMDTMKKEIGYLRELVEIQNGLLCDQFDMLKEMKYNSILEIVRFQ